MILPALAITAQLVSKPAGQSALQRGYVSGQGPDNTVVISLPSGPMTVKIDKGTLPVNTPVMVNVSGE